MNVINFNREPKKLSEMTVSNFNKEEFEKAVEEENVEKKVKGTDALNSVITENIVSLEDLSPEEKLLYGR